MVIAAAAIAKSAVAIPIEIGPARPSWRMAPRLILPRRRCQASGGHGGRRFALRALATLASPHAAALIALHQGLRPLPQSAPNGSDCTGPTPPPAPNPPDQPH